MLERARELIMNLAPPSMRAQFGVMVELALTQMPAESLSALVEQLESAHNEDGTVDPEKLIAIGKGFGMTDADIAGYAAAYGAMADAV